MKLLSGTILVIATVLLVASCGSKRMDLMENNFNSLNRNFRSLESDLNKLKSDHDSLVQAIQVMQNEEITIMRNAIGDLEAWRIDMSSTFDLFKNNYETLLSLERDYERELSELRSKVDEINGLLSSLNSRVTTEVARLSNDLEREKNRLVNEINLTNNDITIFRQQARRMIGDMSTTVLRFGEGLQQTLELQRNQFQEMTDTYNRSISDIEPFLPARALNLINPEELLEGRPVPNAPATD